MTRIKSFKLLTIRPGRARWGSAHVEQLQCVAEEITSSGFNLTDSFEQADQVVIFEDATCKQPQYIGELLRSELAPHLSRCYTYNFDASPVSLFPGVYVSLPRQHFDARLHRAGVYLGEYNEFVSRIGPTTEEPKFLFSFRGSQSHPLRRSIFVEIGSTPRSPITRTYNWFDHNEEQKREYVQEIRSSRFVLCPRGVGTTSARIFETMQLGRVPVIISDDWVPPAGPDWTSFAVFIPEEKISNTAAMIRMHEEHAASMGAKARVAWEQWCSPQCRARQFIADVTALHRMRPSGSDCRFMKQKWTSQQFRRAQGWCVDQKLAQKSKQFVRQVIDMNWGYHRRTC